MKSISLTKICLIFFLFHTHAQRNIDTSMYAMAASVDNEFVWLNIERFSIKNCSKTAEVFNKAHHKYQFDNSEESIEAAKQINNYTHNFFDDHFPSFNMASGIAYAKKTSRVYFFPFGTNELRWVELGNDTDLIKQFGKIKSGNIHINNDKIEPGNSHVSRATIGNNGNGYAITNDGGHLYEFTDEAIPIIKDLGVLVYNSRNDERLSSKENWEGDIVGLTDGNLLLITGSGKLFFINIKTRETTFLFKIKGLQKNVILSGAAVDAQNQLIVSGSHGADGFYKIKINQEAIATQLKDSQLPYSLSDLSSENMLSLPANMQQTLREAAILPNPIQDGSFTILINTDIKDSYVLEITDQNGKIISRNGFKTTNKGKSYLKKSLPRNLATGFYYFVIYNSSNNIILNDKILVSN